MLPTSTNATVDVKAKSPPAAAAVAVFVPEGGTDAGESGKLLTDDERRAVSRLLAAGVSRGKPREVHFDLLEPAGSGSKATKASAYRRVLVVGLGPTDKLSNEA